MHCCLLAHGAAAMGSRPFMPLHMYSAQGTLDCILAEHDGYDKAVAAVRSIYDHLKTPATFVLVSHSPPPDRLELLQVVYWHDIQVR